MSFSILINNRAGSDGILLEYAPQQKDPILKTPVKDNETYCLYSDLAEVDLEMTFNDGTTGRYPVKEHAFASYDVVRDGAGYIFRPVPQTETESQARPA